MSKYWIKRLQRNDEMSKATEEEINAKVAELYLDRIAEIEKKLNKYYTQFSSDKGISFGEAKKHLSLADKANMRKTLTNYQEEYQKAMTGMKGASMGQALLNDIKVGATTSRLDAMRAELGIEVMKLGVDTEKLLDKEFFKAYEKEFYQSSYDMDMDLGIHVGANFNKPDTQKVRKIVGDKFLGENYSDSIWGNKAKLVKELGTIIPRGIANGTSIDKMTKEVVKALGVEKRSAERLVRTEVNFLSNQANKDTYNQHGVEEYEFVATLDTVTSDICAYMDLKRFKVEDAEVGINFPPMHPNCRSRTMPYIPDFDEVLERISRDDDNKNVMVPGDTSYQDWLDKFADKEFAQAKKKAVEKVAGKQVDNKHIKRVPKQDADKSDVIAKQLSKIELLDNLAKRFGDYESNFKDAYTVAPQEIKDALALLEESDALKDIVQSTKYGTSVYDSREKKVYIDNMKAVFSGDELTGQYNTVMHELGHAVDMIRSTTMGIGSSMMSDDFVKALNNDIEAWIGKHKTRGDASKAFRRKYGNQNDATISDMFGAYTKLEIVGMRGHMPDYFGDGYLTDENMMRRAEGFAGMFAAYATRSHNSEWGRLVDAMPESTKVFLELLEEINNGK